MSNQIGFKKQFAININGINTEFVFHAFDNKWMLFITQLGKLPPLYNVQFDEMRDDRKRGPVLNPEFHMSVPVTMKCCMGADSDEIRGGIQFLINQTTLNQCPAELVIGLGLRELDSPVLREVAKVLQELVL